MKFAIVGAACVALSAAAAGAATIQFNEDRGWTNGSLDYSNGHDSVAVSAYEYFNYTAGLLHSGSTTYVASVSGPEGGVNAWSCNWHHWCSDDESLVDGSYGNEMVVFDFGNRVVELTGVTLANADRHDYFDIVVYNNGLGRAPTDGLLDRPVADYSPQFISISSLDTGSVFGVGAYRHGSEFAIQAIHFEVVPLPAAGWLLLAGVGGLAVLKRRKKA